MLYGFIAGFIPGFTPVIRGFTPVIPGFTLVIPGFTPVIPSFTPVIPGFTPVIPGFTPVIPGFTPVIPGFTPVIPAKAGIHTDSPSEPYLPAPPWPCHSLEGGDPLLALDSRLRGNDDFLRGNDDFLRGNDVFLRGNDVFLHGNDDLLLSLMNTTSGLTKSRIPFHRRRSPSEITTPPEYPLSCHIQISIVKSGTAHGQKSDIIFHHCTQNRPTDIVINKSTNCITRPDPVCVFSHPDE
ncbi:hypothetical protein P6910_24285 [Endozoicomonas sp. 8E]|nr:hypothetical protein [Endozoicomonas sp. 8E]WOG27629.1 hypothetical protein P6910_24285 [Endozoicomonas sp. 8E]